MSVATVQIEGLMTSAGHFGLSSQVLSPLRFQRAPTLANGKGCNVGRPANLVEILLFLKGLIHHIHHI